MADVISLNNWTMIPHMSDIWMHIQQEVIPFMKSDRADKIMFLIWPIPESAPDRISWMP